jgi:ribokinase
VDPQVASGIAMITLEEGGQNSIVVAPGANMRLSPEDVSTAWQQLGDIDVIAMPLESPLESVLGAARLARARGARVVLNPAPAQPLPDELLRQVDVLVPNESETALLTGLPVETLTEAEQAARLLLARGVGAVVLTLGTRGALFLDGDGPARRLPAHAVEVVDTTAAGDAFVGTLAVALAEGQPLDEGVRWGNAAGALAVTKLGAQPSLPTRQALQELLAAQVTE